MKTFGHSAASASMPGPAPEGNPNVELTVDEFGTLSDLIYRRIGIRLEPKNLFFSKRVENRLTSQECPVPRSTYAM